MKGRIVWGTLALTASLAAAVILILRPAPGGRAAVAPDAIFEQPRKDAVLAELPGGGVEQTAARRLPGASRESTPESPAQTLHVVSSAGLPLDCARIKTGSAPRWTLAKLGADGELSLRTADLVLLWVPGHRQKWVDASEREVVVEPDALIELSGPQLAQRADSIELMPWLSGTGAARVVEKYCSFGFAAPDRFLIAVNAVEFLESYDKLDVTVSLRCDVAFEVEIAPVSDLRAAYDIPLDSVWCVHERAGLLLRIERRSEQSAVSVDMRRVTGVGASPDSRSVLAEQYPWGRVTASLRDRSAPLVAREAELEISDLWLDGHYVLVARDTGLGDYGRLTFVHDGSPKTVTLDQLGTRLHAVLSSADGRVNVPGEVRVALRHTEPGTLERLSAPWFVEKAVTIMNGNLFITVPARVPTRQEVMYPHPPNLLLEILAEGFELTSRKVVLEVGGIQDIGEILLQPLTPDLLFAPGHGLSGAEIQGAHMIEDGPQIYRSSTGSRVLVDGALALFLNPDSDSVDLPPEFVIVSEVGNNGHAFVRGADGRYERAPTQYYSFVIDIGDGLHEGGTLRVGWRWEGMTFELAKLGADDVGTWRQAGFLAPRHGTELWWSRDGEAELSTRKLDMSTTQVSIP